MVREVTARKGAAAERDRVLLELALGTGIRLWGLVGLNVGHVDLDAKHLTVRVNGGRVETRFLSSDLRVPLWKYMRRRRQEATDSSALFLLNRGKRISNRQVQGRFHLWTAWAGIHRRGLSVHSPRHTFGTRLYRQTRDLVLVGKASGHRRSTKPAVRPG